MEISITDVCQGIAGTLRKKFGYDVHMDELKQGFNVPCFFIEGINIFQKRIGFRRHKRHQTFCVHYYPKADLRENQSIVEMAEKLYFLLELINVNNTLIRGSGMNHKADNGVLHFFVNYNYDLLECPEPDALMENLYQEEILRYERNNNKIGSGKEPGKKRKNVKSVYKSADSGQ